MKISTDQLIEMLSKQTELVSVAQIIEQYMVQLSAGTYVRKIFNRMLNS